MANYGIPYQGSKGQYAPMIFRAISQRQASGGSRTLVDPFCGGYAVSHYFREQGWATVSSDIDRYVVALLRQSLAGLPKDEAYKWVMREMFETARDNPDSLGLPDWQVGFIRIVWSFGNSQTSYLYGKHLEAAKEEIHHLVVSGRESQSLAEMTGVSLALQRKVGQLRTPYARRKGWKRAYLHATKSPSASIAQSASLSRIERVESLQHLFQAERVLASKGVSSEPPTVRDYRSALDLVEPGQAVYLDPPYAGTAGYGEGGFDHGEFWALAEDVARRTQVYVSEYSAPDEWQSVLSFSRPNTAAGAHRASTTPAREHLFTWRGE